MSFTSHVIPIGEGGISPTLQTDIDPIYISGAGDVPAGSIGSEGSNDDPFSTFPDTFVDMAKESEQAYPVSDALPRKKKPFFKKKEKQDEEDEEAEDQLPSEEIL